jgi:hypothetical protein
MFVFVEDSAEALVSSYVQAGDLVWVGDGQGQRMQWSGVGDALVRSVLVVEPFVLTQGVEQVVLVPDQGPVQQLASAGLHPALHDRIHAGHPDAAEHDLDSRVLHDGVEQLGEFAVSVPDQEPRPAGVRLASSEWLSWVVGVWRVEGIVFYGACGGDCDGFVAGNDPTNQRVVISKSRDTPILSPIALPARRRRACRLRDTRFRSLLTRVTIVI